MDKKLAGLLGAVAGIATVGAAQAATQPVPANAEAATSYADLLKPISNPVEALKADDAAQAQKTAEPVQEAQYYPYGYGYGYPYRYHHHHHHHHHHGVVFTPNGVWVR